jgi:hypothetical protein
VKDRLSTLTEALRACDANVEEALEVMRRMNEAELTDEVMTKYFETVFPTLINREQESYHPTTKRKIPNFAKPHYEALVANYRHGKGNNGKTMWDAYNSITEYVDHTKNYSDPVASIGFGWGKNIKQHAFKVGSKFITN